MGAGGPPAGGGGAGPARDCWALCGGRGGSHLPARGGASPLSCPRSSPARCPRPSLRRSLPPSRGASAAVAAAVALAAAAALSAGRFPTARSHLLPILAPGGRGVRSSGEPGGAAAQPRRSSRGTGRPAPPSPPCPFPARSPPSRDGIVAAARTRRGSRRRRRRPSGAPCFPPARRSTAPPIRSR